MAECHHWPIRIKYYTHVSQCSECVCVFKAKIQSVTLTFCSLKEEFVCVSVCLERSWFSWSDVPWDTVTDVTSVHPPSLSLSLSLTHTHTHTHTAILNCIHVRILLIHVHLFALCMCVFACTCMRVCTCLRCICTVCQAVWNGTDKRSGCVCGRERWC